MARFLGSRREQPRAEDVPADLLQSTRETTRIPRELHRRSVRQKLPLTRHRALNQPSEENSDPPNCQQRKPNDRQRVATSLSVARAAAAAAGLQENAPEDRDAKDAMHDSNQ